MSHANTDPQRRNVTSTPKLPEVDSPPPEDVLADAPSKETVVQDARTASEIVDEQPSVADLLGDR